VRALPSSGARRASCPRIHDDHRKPSGTELSNRGRLISAGGLQDDELDGLSSQALLEPLHTLGRILTLPSLPSGRAHIEHVLGDVDSDVMDSRIQLLFPALRDTGFKPSQLFWIKEINRRDDPCSPAGLDPGGEKRSVTPAETVAEPLL
jgi:hypothetical protein